MSLLWRRRLALVALLVGLAIVVVFTRRWVHHAELESLPVIVPASMPASEVVAPSPRTIVARMVLDVQDALAPRQHPRFAVLTFDDGPFPVTTPLLLSQLAALHVPATFFIIGRDAQEQPAITLRAKAQAIELGNHTQTHPEMNSLRALEQQREIVSGSQTIETLTGERPQFFRPPHGNFNADTITAARAAGELVALWDIDPGDWRSLTSAQIAASVIEHARSPAVVLLHNGKEATIEALPQIVRSYRAAGFTFVTLSDLTKNLPFDAINDPIRVSIRPQP